MRLLLCTIGSFGDLNPYIGLGRALAARGHKVALAAPRFYQPHVEAAGLECRPMRLDGDPSDSEMVERIMDPVRGAEYLVRELLMPRLEDTYEDLFHAAHDADAIVSHPITFAAPLVAESRGLPWAGAVLAPLSFFSRVDPPLVVANPAVAAIHRRWPRVAAATIPVGRWLTRSWGDPVQALRRKIGLPRGGHPLYEGQFSPLLNLALFSRVLAEAQADWPPNTVVTGAVSYDAVHGAMPDDLARFLDAGPAPIVFTLGSTAVSVKRAPHFYDASAEAAKSLGRRAVLLVGRLTGIRPAVDPGHTFVAEWAPHSELFHRAAAVVHQGGAGTLNTALAAGRPMLIVPFAHDQPDNAARAERLGVARAIYPQHYTAARVRQALAALLADEGVRSRASAVGAKVSAENGGLDAARALERLTPQPGIRNPPAEA